MTLVRTVMREQIKELIIKRILEGTYKPGQRVVELQLVQELGVSQAPVREALRDLEAMKFIESEPYRGARVRQVTREELTETYPVRAALEELAGGITGPVVDDGMLRMLETEIQNMLEAARKQDQHGLLVHDARFHEIIVEGGRQHRPARLLVGAEDRGLHLGLDDQVPSRSDRDRQRAPPDPRRATTARRVARREGHARAHRTLRIEPVWR